MMGRKKKPRKTPWFEEEKEIPKKLNTEKRIQMGYIIFYVLIQQCKQDKSNKIKQNQTVRTKKAMTITPKGIWQH